MKLEPTAIVSLICLTILGVVVSATQQDSSNLLYAIIAAMGAIAGVGGVISARVAEIWGIQNKWTSVFHIIAGMFAAIIYNWYPGLSISLMAGFLIFEAWQAKKIGDDGYRDFWEALLGYFIGAGVLLVLRVGGII